MSKISTQYGEGAEICLSWQKAHNGEIPRKCVKAGNRCYVARARHNDQFIPGKLFEGEKYMFLSFAGKEYAKTEYEALVDTGILSDEGYCWKFVNEENIPKGAIVGGIDDGEPMYIARSEIDGQTVVGKFYPPDGIAYLPYGGSEHKRTEVELLCSATRKL